MIYKPPDIDRPVFVFQFFFFQSQLLQIPLKFSQISPNIPSLPRKKGRTLQDMESCKKRQRNIKKKKIKHHTPNAPFLPFFLLHTPPLMRKSNAEKKKNTL